LYYSDQHYYAVPVNFACLWQLFKLFQSNYFYVHASFQVLVSGVRA